MNLGEVLKDQVEVIARNFTTLDILSPDQVECSVIMHAAAAGVILNLPPVTPDMEHFITAILNYGAGALSIGCTAGFGGAGTDANGVDLARGEMGIFLCDGLYWYACTVAAPGTL